jgi:hypothetical protein
MTKQCTACSLLLPLSNFSIDSSRHDGLEHRCRDCEAKRARLYRQNNPERRKATKKAYYDANREKFNEASRQRYWANPDEINAIAKQKRIGKEGCLKVMLHSAKARAKKKNWDFDLDMDYLMSIVTDCCPVDGKPFDWDRERELTRDGDFFDCSIPSIDRTDSSKGYVKGNIAIIGDKWNRWKSNMELNDLLLLTQYVQSVTKSQKVP